MRVRAALTVLLSLLMLGSLTRRGWAAWPHDPNNGNVPLCTAANDQASPTIVSDGAGGAIVTWQDGRSGSYDIYAQRVNAAGVPQWTTDGVALCTAANDQTNSTIASDGAGGAIVTWNDVRSGTNNDIYAQRVTAAGATQWTYNGVALCAAASNQVTPTIASDGAGGAIVTWQDYRSGTNNDIYAQRIERFGKLGNPEPVSAGIRDVPNDQGGKVKVDWYGSYLDADPNYEIANYTVWRSAPPNVALSAVHAGAQLLGPEEALPTAPGRVFTSSVERAQTIFWELVGTQIAVGDSGYSFIAPTTSDSVAASNPKTLFRIQARDVNGYAFWNSAPDSGYSVDNLPPAVPAPFAGALSAGVTHLHWGENREPDLAGYRLYRGGSAGFVPGPGNLVVAKPDTGYSDAGPAGSYYKLSAVDLHGNESGYALLTPAGIAGVGPEVAPALALAGAWPNPATGGRLNIAFELPASGPARLELVDVNGRSAALREVGGLGAGRHTVDMAAGRAVPPGLYLVRLSRAGEVRTARAVVLK